MGEPINICIPEDLAESLEVSFQAVGRNLLRELSDVLDIPFRDLVKKVYGPTSTTKVRLCATPSESTSIPIPCKGIVKHYNGGFLCGVQAVQGSCFCSTHFGKTETFNIETAVPLRKLKGIITEELWSTPQGIVVNKESIIVGALKDGVFYKYI
jgi:hypothetical protein